MPSLTFINLSVNKREKIIESAIKEFELYTLKGAKVVRIIKRVNISRASFYKYFEGIEDLYFYILGEIADRTMDELKTELNNAKGDFFNAWDNLFIKFLETPNLYDTAVSRIFTVEHKESLLYARRYNEHLKERIFETYELIDFNKLTITTKQDIVDLLSIVVSTIERILAYVAIDFYNHDQAIKIYHKRMNLIKNSVIK